MGVTGINKILVGGDKAKAREYIGQANSQMEILLQEMSFQNLNQGVRKVQLHKDVWVECRKVYNYQECKIYVTPDDFEGPFYCWESGYFMEGSILERQYDTNSTFEHSVVYVPGANPPDTEEYHIIKRNFSSGYDIDGARTLHEEWDLTIDKPSSVIIAESEIVWQDGIYPYKIEPVINAMNLYTVEACVNGVLEIIENVCGNNLAVYSVGQPVLIAKYNRVEPTYLNIPESIEDSEDIEYIITPFILNKEDGVWFDFEDYSKDSETERYDTVIYDSSIGTGGIRLKSNEDYNNFVVQPITVYANNNVNINEATDFRALSSRILLSTGFEYVNETIPVYMHGDYDYYKYIARGVDIPDTISALDRLSGGGKSEAQIKMIGSYYPGTFFEPCVYSLPDGRACTYPYHTGTTYPSDCYGRCWLQEPTISNLLGLVAYNNTNPEYSSIISWLDSSGYPTKSSSGSINFIIFQQGASNDPNKKFFVWDLDEDTEAKLLNYSGNDYIDFPCDKSELQHWLTITTRQSGDYSTGDYLPGQYAQASGGLPYKRLWCYEGIPCWYWASCSPSGVNGDYWEEEDYPGEDPLWLYTTDEYDVTVASPSVTFATYSIELAGEGQCTDTSFSYSASLGPWTPTGPKVSYEFSASGENVIGGFEADFLDGGRPSGFPTNAYYGVAVDFAGDIFSALETSAPQRYRMLVSGDDDATAYNVCCDLTHDMETECTGTYAQTFITGAYSVTEQEANTTVNWYLTVGALSSYSQINEHLTGGTVIASGSLSNTATEASEVKYLTSYFIGASTGTVYNYVSSYDPIPSARGITVAVVKTKEYDSSANETTFTVLEVKAMQTDPDASSPVDRAFSAYPELESFIKAKMVSTVTYEGNVAFEQPIEARVVSMPYSIPLANDL